MGRDCAFRYKSGRAFIATGLQRKYSPNPWRDGRSDRDGISFRFNPGRRTMGEMMRVDPLSYEELGEIRLCRILQFSQASFGQVPR